MLFRSMYGIVRVESYFASPVWLDYRPEWVDTLNKAGNVHIKNARTKNKDLIKDTKDFGLIHHSDELQSDPNFKTLLDYVVDKSWHFLDNDPVLSEFSKTLFLFKFQLGINNNINKILTSVSRAITPKIHLHPKLGNKSCTGNVEDTNPNEAIINIHEFALCCKFSANQIL